MVTKRGNANRRLRWVRRVFVTGALLATGGFVVVAEGAGGAGDEKETAAGLVEVHYRDQAVVTYEAVRWQEWLVVRVSHLPEWHSYAMDNVQRARQATGKAHPETELPTIIETDDRRPLDWWQTPPVDLSQPAIRWYTWGFEGVSFFASRLLPEAAPVDALVVNGQVCSADACARIDDLEVVVRDSNETEPLGVQPKQLEPVHASTRESGPAGE